MQGFPIPWWRALLTWAPPPVPSHSPTLSLLYSGSKTSFRNYVANSLPSCRQGRSHSSLIMTRPQKKLPSPKEKKKNEEIWVKAKSIVKITVEKKLTEKVVTLSKNQVFFHIKLQISMYLNRRWWEMHNSMSKANIIKKNLINTLFHKRTWK